MYNVCRRSSSPSAFVGIAVALARQAFGSQDPQARSEGQKATSFSLPDSKHYSKYFNIAARGWRTWFSTTSLQIWPPQSMTSRKKRTKRMINLFWCKMTTLSARPPLPRRASPLRAIHLPRLPLDIGLEGFPIRLPKPPQNVLLYCSLSSSPPFVGWLEPRHVPATEISFHPDNLLFKLLHWEVC